MGLFKCPSCPSRHTRVKESREAVPFVRYRICDKCGYRFKTVEVHLEKDSEDYVDMVARMSAERMIDRILNTIISRPVKRILIEQVKRKAGVKKGKATSPAELFQ